MFLSYITALLVSVCVAVMRVQGSLRVVLNTMIWPNMLVERSSKRSVRISAVDADDGIKIYLIQVSRCSCYSSSRLQQKGMVMRSGIVAAGLKLWSLNSYLRLSET